MANTVTCDIVSAEELIFSGDVEAVVATGSEGELGIRPGHTPLLTGVKTGHVRLIKSGGEEELFFVAGGFIEVQPKVVTILSDTVIRGEDIDEAAAEKAKADAEAQIAEKGMDADYDAATAQLAAAMAQLQILAEIKRLKR